MPVKMISQTVQDWINDGALRLCAALAYYSVFSIAPLLIIAISVAGWVLGEDAVSGHLEGQLKAYIGSEAANAIQAMIKSASKPADGIMGMSVGIATLLLGASGVFGQLKDALNIIWDVPPKKGGGILSMIGARLLNFGMVLIIAFLLLISLLLSTALTAINTYASEWLQLPVAFWSLASLAVSLMLATFLFAMIFKLLPDARVQWREVWIGAFITAVLFEAGKWGLSLYLGRESMISSYGAAASVILLLMWVYYASAILLFGAEFTQVHARMTGRGITPRKQVSKERSIA